jgi:hypothetical protein
MLTQAEKEMIYYSLSMRAGYIETGDPGLRAVDAEKQKKPVKALSTDQMKGIIMIEDLMSRVLNDKL